MIMNTRGEIIKSLRLEKNMTQKQLAQLLNVSDKTVSKWECNAGVPEISIINELASLLNVNVEHLLTGQLSENNKEGGNMKRIQFYICPQCGNIISDFGNGDIRCCSKPLKPLIAKEPQSDHKPILEQVENEYFLRFNHEMSKSHYLSFVAVVKFDRMLLIKLYPEQSPELRIPREKGALLYYCCNQEGLFKTKL